MISNKPVKKITISLSPEAWAKIKDRPNKSRFITNIIVDVFRGNLINLPEEKPSYD